MIQVQMSDAAAATAKTIENTSAVPINTKIKTMSLLASVNQADTCLTTVFSDTLSTLFVACSMCEMCQSGCQHFVKACTQNKLSLMALPFKSPSAAQVLPSTHLHCLLELVFRMLAFFFRIAPKQALTDVAPLQQPKLCPSASIDPGASFVRIGFPNLGILVPNRSQTSLR